MAQSTISSRLVIPFVRIIQGLAEIPGLPKLQDVGLSLDDLSKPGCRVSHGDATRLLAEAVRATDCPHLGLLAAEAVTPNELEVWEYAMRTQPTVGRALESMGRLLALLHDGCHLETERQSDTITTRWVFEQGLDPLPAMSDFGVGMSVVVWRRALKLEELTVAAVLLPHAAPADPGPYQRLLRCPVRFNAPFAGLCVPAWVLDVPLPSEAAACASPRSWTRSAGPGADRRGVVDGRVQRQGCSQAPAYVHAHAPASTRSRGAQLS